MEENLKRLLLIDLCARLPYKVMVHIRYNTKEPCYGELTPKDIQWFINSKIEEIKPYLRPMSSMTEEEIKELLNIDAKRGIFSSRHLTWHLDGEVVDYFNSHHFDYRGLISMDLALEASEGMYNIKEK